MNTEMSLRERMNALSDVQKACEANRVRLDAVFVSDDYIHILGKYTLEYLASCDAKDLEISEYGNAAGTYHVRYEYNGTKFVSVITRDQFIDAGLSKLVQSLGVTL